MMAAVPGLLGKVWLKGADEDVYGGLYLWRDQEACQSFLTGELWAEVVEDDSVLDLASRDFAVMEELTNMTQPGVKLV
jgi:putative monooxygenase ydhR